MSGNCIVKSFHKLAAAEMFISQSENDQLVIFAEDIGGGKKRYRVGTYMAIYYYCCKHE